MFINLDNSTTVCPDNAGGVQVYFVGDADDNVRLTEEEAASLLARLEFEVANGAREIFEIESAERAGE